MGFSLGSPIIISGEYRGLALRVGDSVRLRPTLSRIRKSIFDIVCSRFGVVERSGMVFGDIFAGCGSVGLEALSLGFGGCIFLENDRSSIFCLRYNIERCGSGRASVLVGSALVPPIRESCVDILFFDPPYDFSGDWCDLLGCYVAGGWLGVGSLVIVQHIVREGVREGVVVGCESVGFGDVECRSYGKHGLVFARGE